MGTVRVQISTCEGNAAWEFPMKDSVLADKLQSMGCGQEIPISSVIWPSGLNMLNGLMVDADELNFLAKSIERYNESEFDRFIAAANELKSPDVAELINLSFNLEHYSLVTDVTDLAKIGKDHLLDMRGCITAKESATLDFAEIGRNLLTSGKGIPTDYGLLFENDEVPFQQVYDGTTFPPYLYKCNEVAIVHMHYQGKTEYLYLPEEDISIEKALGRLGTPCLPISDRGRNSAVYGAFRPARTHQPARGARGYKIHHVFFLITHHYGDKAVFFMAPPFILF